MGFKDGDDVGITVGRGVGERVGFKEGDDVGIAVGRAWGSTMVMMLEPQ